MFIGHFGLGFAAKKIDSKPSLGTAFLAVQFIDLLWPFFLLLGIEKVAIEPGNTEFTPLNFISYPYTHSLLAVLIWGVLFGLTYFLLRKDKSSAVLLSILVISHWLLDLIVHRPDLPLSFSEDTKVGLGLWNYKMATMAIEIIVFILCVLVYSNTTKAKNRWGSWSLWSLVAFFLAIYIMSAFGDPPPDAEAIGYVGLAQWIFVLWGYWVDRNRIAYHQR